MNLEEEIHVFPYPVIHTVMNLLKEDFIIFFFFNLSSKLKGSGKGLGN